MSKDIEKKFNKLVKTSDPQELEDKLVNYTIEAIDDVFMNGNRGGGLDNVNNSVKFLEDHIYSHPKNFINANYKIMDHFIEMLRNSYSDASLTIQDMKFVISTMCIHDLLYINKIKELILLNKEDDYNIQRALDNLDVLKRFKISILDNEMFQDAITEIKKNSKDNPEYSGIDVELLDDIDKEIQNYHNNE